MCTEPKDTSLFLAWPAWEGWQPCQALLLLSASSIGPICTTVGFENMHKQTLTSSETNSEAQTEETNADDKGGSSMGREKHHRNWKHVLEQFLVDAFWQH